MPATAGRTMAQTAGLAGLLISLLVGARGADRCADARDDIRRAKALATSGQGEQARALLRSALLACPMKPQNLDQLAEAYDSMGDLGQAGVYRGQAMRLRGIRSKPTVSFSAASNSIERGQVAVLNWNAAYATEIEIRPDLGRVAAKGSKEVAPAATTTYELIARGPGGATQTSLEIAVTTPRLTEANLQDLLASEVPQPRIAQLAAERGIAFTVTSEVEARLRDAGAEDALIEALKKAPR
jgi:hypothetical protein